jgi:hypothetical protein
MAKRNSSSKKYWFKANKSGLGWYPGTWQGKIILALCCPIAFVGAFLVEDSTIGWSVLITTFAITAILIKVKGEPHAWLKEQWRLKREYRKNAKHWWQRLP